jgi:hypothetical protein
MIFLRWIYLRGGRRVAVFSRRRRRKPDGIWRVIQLELRRVA